MRLPITHLLPIPLLFWALVPANPYAYYMFLRIVCCGCFAYNAVVGRRENRGDWTYAFAGLAVIYNPVFRIHLDRTFWVIVNILTIVFLVAALIHHERGREKQ